MWRVPWQGGVLSLSDVVRARFSCDPPDGGCTVLKRGDVQVCCSAAYPPSRNGGFGKWSGESLLAPIMTDEHDGYPRAIQFDLDKDMKHQTNQ
jgi:hypothetical protein